jgi:hypothetical protein
MLGRAAPQASLAHLNKVVGQLAARMLNLIHREPHPSDAPADLHAREVELATVHEQTHWAILIAGFVLADEGAGETPTVPEGLLQVSAAQVRLGRWCSRAPMKIMSHSRQRTTTSFSSLKV